MAHVLHYGEESYGIESSSVPGLKDAIAEAVRNRGGWVTVRGFRRSGDIFVSSGQYIRISERADTEGRAMFL